MPKKRADFFNLIKPLLKRFLTGLVMFVIAENGYQFFKDNENSIIKLKEDLEKPLITEVKYVDWYETCPDDFIETPPSLIPGRQAGCACDGEILLKDKCTNTNISENENNPLPSCIEINEIPEGRPNGCKTKCCYCFDYLEEEVNPREFFMFYEKRLCYKTDKDQNTQTYLESFLYKKCDEGNECNDYFCRFDNYYFFDCPLTNTVVNDHQTQSLITDSSYILGTPFEQPLIFTGSYELISQYDHEGFPIINLPSYAIHYANNFMCDDMVSSYRPHYPLITPVFCLESIRFTNLDSTDQNTIVNNNNFHQYYSKNYPLYKDYFKKDIFSLQTEHALNINTVSCLLKQKSIFIKTREKTLSEEEIKKLKENIKKEIILPLVNYIRAYVFIKDTLRALLVLQSLVIFLDVVAVTLKLFNCIYDYFKPVFCFYNYENFLSLTIDFIVLIIAANSNSKLIAYQNEFNSIANDPTLNKCLGEYGTAMLINFATIASTIQGGHFNLALIASIRFIMIALSLLHYFFTTNWRRIKKGEVTTILLEKENTKNNIENQANEDDEDEEGEEGEEEEEEDGEGGGGEEEKLNTHGEEKSKGKSKEKKK